MQPSAALSLAVHYLDRELAPSAKVRAFQRALQIAETLGESELAARAAAGTSTTSSTRGRLRHCWNGPETTRGTEPERVSIRYATALSTLEEGQ